MSELLTIRAVADRFGLTLRSLRFWEDKGLIAPAREGQARLYGPDQVARVGQIAAWSRAGVTLADIGVLLRMSAADQQADLAPRLAALRSLALVQIAAIDALTSLPLAGEDGKARRAACGETLAAPGEG